MSKARTLSDVAGRLGLSVATVSRALADHEQIAPATRERVAQAAREMGYVPNRAARALVSGRSGFVGFVLPLRGPGLADQFLGQFLGALAEGVGARGLDLLISAVPRGKSELRQLDSLATSAGVDGLVLGRIGTADARVALLQKLGLPFVTHGRLLDSEEGYTWLDTDGAAAFAEAFEMLHALGHRRFGFLTIDDPMTFAQLREGGLRAAIDRRADPEVSLRVVAAPRYDAPARAGAVAAMLAGADRPTAVLALFDGLAMDLLTEAGRAGLSVPDDLSVIGFDNVPAAAYAPPGLTTFDARIEDCATTIAGMLADRLADPSSPHTGRLVKPLPVLRGSHGAAPAQVRAVRH